MSAAEENTRVMRMAAKRGTRINNTNTVDFSGAKIGAFNSGNSKSSSAAAAGKKAKAKASTGDKKKEIKRSPAGSDAGKTAAEGEKARSEIGKAGESGSSSKAGGSGSSSKAGGSGSSSKAETSKNGSSNTSKNGSNKGKFEKAGVASTTKAPGVSKSGQDTKDNKRPFTTMKAKGAKMFLRRQAMGMGKRAEKAKNLLMRIRMARMAVKRSKAAKTEARMTIRRIVMMAGGRANLTMRQRKAVRMARRKAMRARRAVMRNRARVVMRTSRAIMRRRRFRRRNMKK